MRVQSFDAFRAHCTVLFDDDELCERFFGLFRWVAGDSHQLSFDAWISVWQVSKAVAFCGCAASQL